MNRFEMKHNERRSLTKKEKDAATTAATKVRVAYDTLSSEMYLSAVREMNNFHKLIVAGLKHAFKEGYLERVDIDGDNCSVQFSLGRKLLVSKARIRMMKCSISLEEVLTLNPMSMGRLFQEKSVRVE